MKKLFLIFLILTTFLFITSCDTKEPENNESSSSNETSNIEETSTEENIEYRYPYPNVIQSEEQERYYDQILGGEYLGNDFENSPDNKVSYRLIKTHEELVELVEYGKSVEKDLFDKNYVLVLQLKTRAEEYMVFRKYSFYYFNSSTKSIEGTHTYTNSDTIICPESPIGVTEFFYVVIPKSEINDSLNSFGEITLCIHATDS